MIRYCSNCGKKITEDNIRFCMECGAKLVDLKQQNTEAAQENMQVSTQEDTFVNTQENMQEQPVENMQMDQNNGVRRLEFCKRKMLGKFTYKMTSTVVDIDQGAMHIVQQVKRLFRKEQNTEELFQLSEINFITMQTKMDFWDTLYGIIFFILGFIEPICFLCAAIWFYCGYGKEVRIQLENGKNILIPSELKTESVEEIMKIKTL